MHGSMEVQFKMTDKAIEPGKKETERYLPKEAWARMSPEQRKETDDKKRRESRSGKQFVENTETAKKARRAVELASKRKS
jgi:hypothetical protein